MLADALSEIPMEETEDGMEITKGAISLSDAFPETEKKEGYYAHFHVNGRQTGAHSFFGTPRVF